MNLNDFLKTCSTAAGLCGVTRLANVTGLDRLGLPVWQAVRPASRALSVHQGKAETDTGAMIGALCEAIESHCAESVPPDGPNCSLDELDEDERAACLSDYCRDRGSIPAPDEPIQWCTAADLVTGRPFYLPHACVSLDYTFGLPSRFDRTSNGIGAGPTEAHAVSKALLECIERDAIGEWSRSGAADREATSVDPDTIPFEWFRSWRDRLHRSGIAIAVNEIDSLVGFPTFRFVIGAYEEFGQAYRQFFGVATDGNAEIALFKAFAEALQSRLTLIAGARDDILPSYYKRHEVSRRPAGDAIARAARVWKALEPVQNETGSIAERLEGRGYGRIAVKRLDRGLDGLAVIKAFVPGLGSLSRTRKSYH